MRHPSNLQEAYVRAEKKKKTDPFKKKNVRNVPSRQPLSPPSAPHPLRGTECSAHCAQYQNKSTFAKVNHCQSIWCVARRLANSLLPRLGVCAFSGFDRINKYSYYTLYWTLTFENKCFSFVSAVNVFDCVSTVREQARISQLRRKWKLNGIDVNGIMLLSSSISVPK